MSGLTCSSPAPESDGEPSTPVTEASGRESLCWSLVLQEMMFPSLALEDGKRDKSGRGFV